MHVKIRNTFKHAFSFSTVFFLMTAARNEMASNGKEAEGTSIFVYMVAQAQIPALLLTKAY